jgi:hypothetical protein
LLVRNPKRIAFHRDAITHQSIRYERVDREISKWTVENLSKDETTHVVARIKIADSGFVRLPYKFMIRSFNGKDWCKEEKPFRSLGKSTISPGDFGWIE